MKELLGSPGTVSGLLLRLGQCAFAAASIGVMVSANGFSSYTAFCYLIASMGLQLLWSFGLACLDIYALRRKKDLQNPVLVSLFVVGDWVLNSHQLSSLVSLPFRSLGNHSKKSSLFGGYQIPGSSALLVIERNYAIQ
ncbi:unnamed protein product [Linum tenue]|uniref:CASP-like protein n=1 Tax=Linum tenue TaxID=586396 RepID=A0AAV0L0L3_9ROSI|nr:unnamed protein product [Linum tenue]